MLALALRVLAERWKINIPPPPGTAYIVPTLKRLIRSFEYGQRAFMENPAQLFASLTA
jgi:hypothetical protein